MRRLTSLPPAAVLAGLVFLSADLRWWAGSAIPTPWIVPDEPIYAALGTSLWRTGHFQLLGEPAGFFSLVYPALAGLPLVALGTEHGYAALKALQALVVSLTAVPVYLWSRSLVRRRSLALVPAALTLTLPGLAYSGLVMTEVAFLPTVLLAAWAIARALERPTLARQALLVGAILLATATRLQAFVLVPVLATALLLQLVLERDLGRVRRFAPSGVALSVAAAAWALWRLAHGGPASQLFGAYQQAGQVHYSVGEAAKYVLWHAGDVILFTAVAPVCALALLLLEARRLPTPVRAYVVVATASTLWLVVEVGVFASRHVGYLAERNLLPLAPVLFVALGVWLDRGAARPRLRTLAVCTAALALVAILPLGRLVTLAATPDSFTIVPLLRLREGAASLDPDLVATLAAGGVLAAFAILPRRLVGLLPLALGVLLAGTSIWASHFVAGQAREVQSQTVGAEPRWIDRSASGPVAFLYTGEIYWNAVWESAFWNRRLDEVYGLLGATVPGGLPQRVVSLRDDGRLVLPDGRPAASTWAVATSVVRFVGRPLAEAGSGLLLWRLDGPFRVSTWTQRAQEGGRSHTRVLVYDCHAGKLDVGLAAAAPGTVELRRNDLPLDTVRLAAGQTFSRSIAAAPAAGRGTCTFDVVADAGISERGLEFVRS